MDSSKITELIRPKYIIEINEYIKISDTIIIMWLIMAFLVIASIILTRNLKTIPSGKQNFVETVVESINNLTKSIIGNHWKSFAPYIGTIFLFLIFANTISIFNIIPSAKDLDNIFNTEFFTELIGDKEISIIPPTRDINVTASLAVMSIVVVTIAGIKVKKPVGFIKEHFQPLFIVGLFIKILDYFARPMSLCFRLFGNIVASIIIMEIAYNLPVFFHFVLPGALSIYFDLFDGGLQAIIFVFLTSIYISEAVE